jgi:hypothetical protein
LAHGAKNGERQSGRLSNPLLLDQVRRFVDRIAGHLMTGAAFSARWLDRAS